MAANNSNNHPASSSNILTERLAPDTFPGFGPKKKFDEVDFNNYRVRYEYIDIMDAGSKATLEIIETKAFRNQGIVVLTKDKFTFMDKYFILISYLELDENANITR
jgi:hypothetical protein